jgi:hypothetical protein
MSPHMVGHKVPQEAAAFAQAIVNLDGYSR